MKIPFHQFLELLRLPDARKLFILQDLLVVGITVLQSLFQPEQGLFGVVLLGIGRADRIIGFQVFRSDLQVCLKFLMTTFLVFADPLHGDAEGVVGIGMLRR